jgi:hypothetical protein
VNDCSAQAIIGALLSSSQIVKQRGENPHYPRTASIQRSVERLSEPLLFMEIARMWRSVKSPLRS